MLLRAALLLPALLAPCVAASQCARLPRDVCAAVCVPFDAGKKAQRDFSCGDWWIRATCCNGTRPQSLVSSTYFDCTCETDALTATGLAAIVSLVLIACVALLAAVFYVLHRKKKRIQAEEEERDKAIEEAQVYLPR